MTRRELFAVVPALALAGCEHRKSPRYQGYALIANHDSHTVAVIDLSRFAVLKEVALPFAPSWVVAVPEQQRAYLLSAESPNAEVLNLDTMNLGSRIGLGGRPVAARLCSERRTLWVALREPNALAGLDAGSGARVTQVRLPSTPSGIDADGEQVVLAFAEARLVGRFDLHQNAMIFSPTLKAAPTLICLRPDGIVALTGNADRSMTALDAKTLRPLVDLPMPLAPRHFCFNNDGGQLFVTGEGMDAVCIVSPYQTEVGETILAGNQPCGMAATTTGPNYLFVANESGDVTVINIDTRRTLAQIPVGQKPNTILLTPDNEYALVLNEQSGDVAVVRLLSIRQANLSARRSRMAPLFTMIPVGGRPVGGSIAPRLT